MKLKKTFSFSDKNQIWRLLISDSDKLVVETRDTDKKEVYFHCIDLIKGKRIFKGLQIEEKYWVGIETIYKNKIYFHHFAKPNMPEHKKIIAYDIIQEKILWQNEDLIFLSINDDKLYAFKKKFEGQDLFVLNCDTGEIIEELGNDANKLNNILNESKFNEDFSEYKYPEEYTLSQNDTIDELINREIKGQDIIENPQLLLFGDFVCLNYYRKLNNNLLDNEFVVYNIGKKKKVIAETINKNLNSFSPDSYFGYKDYLLVLKNKNEIIAYKIS